MSIHLVWFRSDLRTLDNPALYAAAVEGRVTALFLLTPEQWRQHGIAAKKISFLLRSVDNLSENLANLGIETRIVTGSCFNDAAEKVVSVAQEIGASRVFWNNEIALDEQRRDTQVEKALTAKGIEVRRTEAATSLPVGAVRKPDGMPYSVFTPYKKRWISLSIDRGIQTLPVPDPQGPAVTAAVAPKTINGVSKIAGADDWPAGESSALTLLDKFLDAAVENYATHRDLPSLSGTSKLSPHLAAGTVSANQCLSKAYRRNQERLVGGNESIDTWISELIWREFYNHIMAENPRLAMGRAFKTETDALPSFLTTTTENASPAGSALPTLELPRQRVFVLTTNSTCSASEAIINGLRGVDIEVIQFGSTTCGKPYGFYPQDNCGTTYFTTQFRSVNSAGFGDYPDGFSPANSNESTIGVTLPGCQAVDDFSPLGEITEPMLAAALAYRENGGRCSEASSQATTRGIVSSLNRDSLIGPTGNFPGNMYIRPPSG